MEAGVFCFTKGELSMGISAMSGSVNTQVPDYYQKQASGKKTDAAPEETTAAANAGMAETSVVQAKIETQDSKEQNQKSDTNVAKMPDNDMSEYLKKIAEESMDRLTSPEVKQEPQVKTSDTGRELENFRVENQNQQQEVISNMASQLS